jgi:hypothetical protein
MGKNLHISALSKSFHRSPGVFKLAIFLQNHYEKRFEVSAAGSRACRREPKVALYSVAYGDDDET